MSWDILSEPDEKEESKKRMKPVGFYPPPSKVDTESRRRTTKIRKFRTYDEFIKYCKNHKTDSYCDEFIKYCEITPRKHWRAIVMKFIDIQNRL
ncbi:MAG: hypothetical protein DRI44_02695 [Chlamydiae bacterium]|nr:MAG: hypothetical protein DRI44_02695 [Chlamydiota bacterium]